MRRQTLPRQSAHIVYLITILWKKCFKKIRKEKKKARSAGTSSNKNSDRPARKCFRCRSEDHMIAKCPNPPKDSDKRRKSEKSKEKGNCACDNSDDDNELKVYTSDLFQPKTGCSLSFSGM